MNKDNFWARKRNAGETQITKKILSLKTIKDIHAFTSRELPDFFSGHPDPEAHKRITTLIQTQVELVRFDEFKDQELADWKRIRAAIEHENTLINHRLTWLLTSQGFLFTGFGVVFSTIKQGHKNPYAVIILFVIAVLGMAISFKIFVDIEDAANQLLDLDCWWYSKYAPEDFSNSGYASDINMRERAQEKLQECHPALQGRRNRKMFWLDKGLKVEISFFVAWVVILSGVVAKPLLKVLCETSYEYSDVFYFIPAAFAMIGMIIWRFRYRSKSKRRTIDPSPPPAPAHPTPPSTPPPAPAPASPGLPSRPHRDP